MISALAYEWVRIRTIRSTWWLSGAVLVVGIGLSFLTALGTSLSFDSSNEPTTDDFEVIASGTVTQFANFGAPYFVAYILAMLGVLSWGHEYRHGMIRATLTTLSSRTAAWAAKFVVVGLWTAGVMVLTLFGSALVGWAWLADNGIEFWTGDVFGLMARAVLYAVLLTFLAMTFTSIVRNQTFGLVTLFLWPLAIENIVKIIFAAVPGLRDNSDVTRFLPFDAGGRILDDLFQAGDGLFGVPMSALGGGIIFGGLTLVLMGVSLTLFRSRDA